MARRRNLNKTSISLLVDTEVYLRLKYFKQSEHIAMSKFVRAGIDLLLAEALKDKGVLWDMPEIADLGKQMEKRKRREAKKSLCKQDHGEAGEEKKKAIEGKSD